MIGGILTTTSLEWSIITIPYIGHNFSKNFSVPSEISPHAKKFLHGHGSANYVVSLANMKYVWTWCGLRCDMRA